jgi:RND family efflux transporter MFP subunit
MSIATKGLTLLVVAGGIAGAAVYWPAHVEKYVPGFTQRTAYLRALLPGAKENVSPSAGRTARAQNQPGLRTASNRPPVPVEINTVQRGPMPLRVDAVGTVQPIATIAIRSRVDAQIEKIFVSDGAKVQEGDPLVKLDSRQIEAQIRQTEAMIAKDRSAVEQSTRDVARAQDLLNKGAGPQLNLDNFKTQLAAAKATLDADRALLDNQKVQLSWYMLKAPITGRVGTFNAKAGNIIRSGDNTATGILATIVETTPIYVAFPVPQIFLAQIREAVEAGEGEVRATPQGGTRSATGKISVLDNQIDPSTGTIMIRAKFDNPGEVLWPGQLCNVRVTLRTDPDVVSIPRSATQSGQIGNFVYVVENGIARVRRIKVGRFQDGRDVVLEGLKGGESVVSDGALLLVDGARVDVRKTVAADKGAI